MKKLGLLLVLVALLQAGCSGGGGSDSASSSRGSSGSGSQTTSPGITAEQKQATATAAEAVSDILSALAGAESVLQTGFQGLLPRAQVAVDVTSQGRAVIEGGPGVLRVTVYDATLQAGVNFTDSDASNTVSSQAEKDSITALRVAENYTEYQADLENRSLEGTQEVRTFGAGGAVDRFIQRSFSLAATGGETTPVVDVQGRHTAWSGEAAATAAEAESPDPSTADQSARFHSSWDLADRTSGNAAAVATRGEDGTWRLSIAHSSGQLQINLNTFTATVSHQGTLESWTRSGAFDLDAEVAEDFSFTPAPGDTQVVDVAVNLTTTGNGQGDPVVQGTVRDALHGLTFTFTIQNGLLTGAVVGDDQGHLASVTLDRQGNGQIVFADGTVVPIENFQVSGP